MTLSATNNNGFAQSYKGIARKLITRTILFSSAITLIITAFNLYERYNYDISLIDSRLDQINNVHLSSLSNNLWLADKPELQIHLNGILKIPDIQYLEVYSEDNELWASAGTKKRKNVKQYVLVKQVSIPEVDDKEDTAPKLNVVKLDTKKDNGEPE